VQWQQRQFRAGLVSKTKFRVGWGRMDYMVRMTPFLCVGMYILLTLLLIQEARWKQESERKDKHDIDLSKQNKIGNYKKRNTFCH
jgi:hypothetical protein